MPNEGGDADLQTQKKWGQNKRGRRVNKNKIRLRKRQQTKKAKSIREQTNF